MKSQAIVFTKAGQAELQEIEVPEPGPDDVVVRSVYSGVSVGTDGWIFTNQFRWGGDIPYPVVPGYQRAGYVESWGENVREFTKGQLVAATVTRLEGSPASFWGGHVHRAAVHQNEVYPLPDGVSAANAAQFIVAQVGYNAATRVALSKAVLVLGAGCIGQMAAQAARARGARVILAGHRRERLELAKRHSCDEAVQTREKDWTKCFEDTELGTVIDTVQSEKFFEEYLPHLPHRANIVLSGFSPAGFRIDLGEVQKKEAAVLTVGGWTRQRCEETLKLMSGKKIDFEGLLTHVPHASEAGAIYQMMQEKSAPFLGINFRWE